MTINLVIKNPFLLVFSVFHLQFFLSSAQDFTQTPSLGISQRGTKCYDSFNRPQRCIPEFENAAFNVLMEATNTCGDQGAIDYCVQTGASSVKKSCDVCEPNEHDSRFLTDLHNQENQTWWQSETMFEGIQFPSQVNLTLNLRKAFDITYVRIWFYSPRPESFAIYKRTKENGPWVPYQFYSATCRDTYGLPDKRDTAKGEETRALCTSEYSDISPLRDGNVAFSTLEGRPSAYNFESSPELQEWVTATDIRISLDRINTFGDEVFGDQQVLRSYFYAIADVAVGARCKCNGHASECVSSTGSQDSYYRRVCLCEHHTAGPDCNECEPFYNDVPWGRATARDTHECKPCNCNGFSNRCFFDKDLYNRTGHGGHCLDCSANRDGPNCERCRENYYQREDQYCVACNCDPIGSRNLQCNREGKCQCKPGVTGDKCDRCDVNHYDFESQGCKSCGCSEAGSKNNRANCDPVSGVCFCKENVEGKRCRECKPGFFNLDFDNDFGCTPCFCYGHSSQCETAPGYSKVVLESMFARSTERWNAQDEHIRPVNLQYHGLTQTIGAAAQGYETIYFLAPDRFLGDQRASYNKDLTFTLRIGESGPNPTARDIILEGAGTYVTSTIFAQNNQLPSVQNQIYKFRLHEHPEYGWNPRLSARAFMSILTNLTAIKIRATYTPQGVGFLDDVQLETAHRGAAGSPATWVERCDCPQGYVGQFCESCAPGYRHSPALGGPFMPCIPCDCNKHADICESETGRCICQHNTAGDNCELCARGYYGNALEGSPDDCKPCLCPGGGACMLLHDETLVCLECPEGYVGPRCDLCSDGYFGDPNGVFGAQSQCRPCECNQNVDRNAVGNCNRTTGECLKCIHNTGGSYCDQCLPGYFGDALALPRGDCKPCKCYRPGTEENEDGEPLCDQTRGNCKCRPFVKGHNCDQCEDGYYNIISGEGCQPCNCNPIGSLNGTCDLYTGQCHCRTGITGLRCDQCETYKYGFSSEGCRNCDCDRIGSKSLQCHATTGQCPCLDNVEGRKCDRCKENKYDRKRGCIDCPACYNLVQTEANRHLAKLQDFERKLNEINSSAIVISDAEFEDKLHQVQAAVEDLLKQARQAIGGDDKTLLEKLNDIRDRQRQVSRILEEVEENMQVAEEKGLQGLGNITETGKIIEKAKEELNAAMEVLLTDGKSVLQKATERAKEFGQHSETMTKLVHEARERVNQLEDHAKEIDKVAKEVRNVSTKAHDLHKKIQEDQIELKNEVNKLENEVGNLGKELEHVQEAADEALERATKAETKSLTTLNEVENLIIPTFNVSLLKNNAELTKNESLRIINETNKLMENNDALLSDIREQVSVAADLLDQGREQQVAISDLFSDIDVSHTVAKNAVQLGDETFSEAQETYNTLAGFDREVQASKNSADEALKQIPEIQQTIDEAEKKSNATNRLVDGAKKNAQTARDLANQAQTEYAEQASNETEQILSEADKMRVTAGKLRDEAESLAGRVAMTDFTLQRLENQTVSNRSVIQNAKEKVNQAETNSKDAEKKVLEVMDEVDGIVNALSGLPDIDPDELDKLEKKLKAAEEELERAKLNERKERLTREMFEQKHLIVNYRDELDRLQKEVENIEAIMLALPETCSRSVELEP